MNPHVLCLAERRCVPSPGRQIHVVFWVGGCRQAQPLLRRDSDHVSSLRVSQLLHPAWPASLKIVPVREDYLGKVPWEHGGPESYVAKAR